MARRRDEPRGTRHAPRCESGSGGSTLNGLDVAILVAALVAGIGGWRFGFISRVFAWCGVAVALAVGIPHLPRVVTAFGGTNADDRVTVAGLFLLVVATLGQAVGLGVGVLMQRLSKSTKPLPRWDRAAGAAVGTVGVVALVWMMIPSLAMARGWPARMSRDSAIVGVIDGLAPAQPAQFAIVGLAISEPRSTDGSRLSEVAYPRKMPPEQGR